MKLKTREIVFPVIFDLIFLFSFVILAVILQLMMIRIGGRGLVIGILMIIFLLLLMTIYTYCKSKVIYFLTHKKYGFRKLYILNLKIYALIFIIITASYLIITNVVRIDLQKIYFGISFLVIFALGYYYIQKKHFQIVKNLKIGNRKKGIMILSLIVFILVAYFTNPVRPIYYVVFIILNAFNRVILVKA